MATDGLQNVAYEVTDGVATILLNRPDLLNPLDHITVTDLHACLDRIAADAAVDLVLIRGAGRAFSAGGDLKWGIENHRNVDLMRRMGEALRGVLARIEASDRLFVAVIEGLAVAGGIELMLACDYVLASERAKFSDGHLNFSLLPGAGGTQRMPRLMGMLRAKDLLLTARMIDAAEAKAMGLITATAPVEGFEAHLGTLVADLQSKSFSSRAAIKHLVNRGAEMEREAALTFEGDYVLAYETSHPDTHEGLTAFLEKRRPVFLKPGAA